MKKSDKSVAYIQFLDIVQGTMNEDLMLEKRLDYLRGIHTELEEKLASTLDEFTKMRIKKEKLHVRDKMMEIESQLYPDVIA